MPTTLAFDIYGTLIDTNGVVDRLREHVGDRAEAFSRAWRDKQLEYTFRRGLMQNPVPFAVCTRQALDYCCAVHEVQLAESDREELMRVYDGLPAFDDVVDCLQTLAAEGHRLYAFSNGDPEAVNQLLAAAGIRDAFLDIVSTAELKSFKPNPAVYCHFLRRAGATGERAWLISGNPFDIIGAVSAGMKGAWVRRSAATVFDPWGIEPTATVTGLQELPACLRKHDTTA